MIGINQIPGLLEALRAEIDMEDPHDLDKYLGAIHKFRRDGNIATLGWDMSNYLSSACRAFEEATKVKLKPASTPYAPEISSDQLDRNLAQEGAYKNIAASMLMRILYPGRMATPTVVVAIQRLAKRITKWCRECDRRLIRLYEYAYGAQDYLLEGSLSTEDRDVVELHVYADGDLNGNMWDTKSTAGFWIELSGLRNRTWPVYWASKAEPATASTTQESEMVALSMAARNEACPLQLLLSTLLGRPVVCKVFEDNAATITAAEKDYSPSLRHLRRHQRCALSTVHETFFIDEDCTDEELAARRSNEQTYGQMLLLHKETSKHKADFFTKELSRVQFQNALKMMNVRSRGAHT